MHGGECTSEKDAKDNEIEVPNNVVVENVDTEVGEIDTVMLTELADPVAAHDDGGDLTVIELVENVENMEGTVMEDSAVSDNVNCANEMSVPGVIDDE